MKESTGFQHWTRDSRRHFVVPTDKRALSDYKLEALYLYTEGWTDRLLRPYNNEVVPEYIDEVLGRTEARQTVEIGS